MVALMMREKQKRNGRAHAFKYDRCEVFGKDNRTKESEYNVSVEGVFTVS